MQRKIIHVKKSSVALKRELILHPIYEGFCYPWRTKGQKGPLENWELDWDSHQDPDYVDCPLPTAVPKAAFCHTEYVCNDHRECRCFKAWYFKCLVENYKFLPYKR